MPDADARVLVLGAGGQVGRALVALLGERGRGLDRAHADLTFVDALPDVLATHGPSVVINAAAYTEVDRAESDIDTAMIVNAEAPGVIARWCAAEGIPFVHFSTDYVFDGAGDEPHRESDPVAPLSIYGASKLAGERRVAESGGDWLVVRTSWVYDAIGRNFLTTMLRLMRERSTLDVVDDQHGAPTYAPHLAAATLAALDRACAIRRDGREYPRGIYHLCATGETTWHGFAVAIGDEARRRGIELAIEQIIPIPSDRYPVAAVRPKNSRLNTDKAHDVLGVRLPHWREGLTECIEHV
jgi:dTDP-4-dehydrorhamnose reductase